MSANINMPFAVDDYKKVRLADLEQGCKINPVQIAAEDPGADIIAILGAEGPVLSDGRNRDEEIGRWLRESLSDYIDFRLYQIDDPVVPDGLDEIFEQDRKERTADVQKTAKELGAGGKL